MKKIYIISGLGVDERIFYKIDFSGYDVTFIHWIIPEKKETIESYAFRLSAQIKTSNPVLIGLSFGGIMAIEIAKQIAVKKIIIISSAKTRSELPLHFRLTGKLGIHKIVPPSLLKKTTLLTDWLFGIESKEDKKLLKRILANVNTEFLKWAVDRIVHWQNKMIHPNLSHIHGTGDKLLPIRNVASVIKVKAGGHFMLANKATELTELIRMEIEN